MSHREMEGMEDY